MEYLDLILNMSTKSGANLTLPNLNTFEFMSPIHSPRAAPLCEICINVEHSLAGKEQQDSSAKINKYCKTVRI